MDTIRAKASADVGNSSTKVIMVDGEIKKARKQPTVISYLPAVPKFEDEELNVLVTNLHKNIVVNITSSSISRNGLFAVGDVANIYGGSGFNIKLHKKAERDLTIIQPLAMVATTAIQNAFAQSGELPAALTIDLEYATAIPVVDYSKADAKALEGRLFGNHILTVYVGEGHQVQVTVNIVSVKVVQEGIPAFYALIEGNPSLFEAYNKRYNIGDGTIELIAIVNSKPVVTKSNGVRLGVGHASEKAVISFKSNYNFNADLTRANFMDKVLNKNDNWHNEASNELKLAVFEQEQRTFDVIVDTIENVLLSDLDDVVVFGGGTNVFTKLEEQLVTYTGRYKMRVLWITGKESSLLNAIGLDELNNKVFFKK